MIPVPGYPQSTPYGKRGPYWSCSPDAYGNGIHTGADYAAPTGARVVAARAGKAVYCNHGSAFGSHQLEIVPGDGTRDFYAHMTTRTVPDQSWVAAGATVGKVGAEGNATGPHLHFERHSVPSGPWNCSIIRDPAPSINYLSEAVKPIPPEDDVTENDIQKIVTRVVKAMGDYNAAGKPQEKYKSDPAEGDNRLRSVSTRLTKVEDTVNKIWQKVK